MLQVYKSFDYNASNFLTVKRNTYYNLVRFCCMDLDEYQKKTRETAIYPSENAIEYLTLGLNDESGEVAGAFKKYIRGDYDEDELRERISGEAGDVLWYWSRLLDEMDLTASDVMEKNADKLFDRKDRGVIQGDGDNR